MITASKKTRGNLRRCEGGLLKRIWFLLIDGKEEGPYTIAELRRHIRLTPDTPVRRKGTSRWILLRFIPELQSIFEDEPEKKLPADKKKGKGDQFENGATVLALRHDPPSFYFWLLIAAIVLFYVLYQLSHS